MTEYWTTRCRLTADKLDEWRSEFYFFVSLQQRTIKLGSFTDFKAFFLAVLKDFRWLAPVKIRKKMPNVLYLVGVYSAIAEAPHALSR